MATIQKRIGKTGKITYQAKIRRKCKGKIIHEESKTFDKKNNAELWVRNREAKLDDPHELNKIQSNGITVGQVFKMYLEEFSYLRTTSRSKAADLKRLQNTDLAELDAITLTSSNIIQHLIHRLQFDGVKPQTAILVKPNQTPDFVNFHS